MKLPNVEDDESLANVVNASEIELVVTDLDGTLWDANCNLSDGTLEAIAELKRRNIGVLAATARGASATFETFEKLGLHLPAVLCNGALGRLPNGETFHSSPFPTSTVQELLEILATAGLVPHVAVDHPQYGDIAPVGASSNPEFDAQCGSGLLAGDLGVALTHDVTQLRVLGIEQERLDAPARACSSRGDTRVYFAKDAVFGGWSLELAPIAADKWSGVLAYCATEGLDPSRVLGIGDGINDIAFLSRSRVSIAMADAASEVTSVAHFALAPGDKWPAVLNYL